MSLPTKAIVIMGESLAICLSLIAPCLGILTKPAYGEAIVYICLNVISPNAH